MTTATPILSAVEGRSKLNVYDENAPAKPLVATTDGAEIARLLGEVGVRFERWTAEAELAPDADSGAVLAAYANSVKRVQSDGGYGTVDVLRLAKGTPNTAPMRAKFLDEHIHTENEVRFFVEGSGAFYLHLSGKVYQAICVRGDLISVPAGTPHWFDMGPDPEFTAIRWFNNQEGWVPQYSGTAIAARFPKYE
jgi:1,2-dihydroxy-3-keto-5-methylthiopentene dioxygenase